MLNLYISILVWLFCSVSTTSPFIFYLALIVVTEVNTTTFFLFCVKNSFGLKWPINSYFILILLTFRETMCGWSQRRRENLMWPLEGGSSSHSLVRSKWLMMMAKKYGWMGRHRSNTCILHQWKESKTWLG